ncbi:Peptidyl-prolyl cis-trans isomerase, cyclophilin-type, putative [Polymorphum gilvum SL003B-26A1]|uniref:Peptidyl-prolyl cis-trans isomerase n=2 Tax=Polymorphum TaxID=991903 RepID=F2IZS1_POLGS|nr:Peptidyl-prolyl cis-trans isomerase, cyclophilin-type, putative [Polymorphum gilvum SL003B-26A1]
MSAQARATSPTARYKETIVSRLLAVLALIVPVLLLPAAGQAQTLDPENTLYMDLKDGRVTIRLRPDLAPAHVERIKMLTRKGFYDGLTFHRVIDGFMAQTGDPTGTGMGGSEEPDLKAEFSPRPFERGVLGMARAQSPDSANSQFFIMFAAAPWLTRNYTVWGEVVDGMEFIDMIAKGEPPANPDRILKMQVAADAG